jgi:CubicO group peptidase (beta-lactamase class C family)
VTSTAAHPGEWSPGPFPVTADDREDRVLRVAVDEILNRWPAVGLALGVVRDGRLVAFHGHGVADLVSKAPVTEQTVFRIGSITKTFTAIAVMQLWERGLVDLDAPATDSLRAFRLVLREPGMRPPTLRQLLTHTSGIPDVRRVADLLHFGDGPWDARPPIGSVPFGERVPSLADYYRDGLEVVVEPGSAFAYSNHAFATLGQIVEDVSGTPIARYLLEHVFEPLGMASTDVARTAGIAARLATGYAMARTGPHPVPDRDWISGGFGGAYSTVADLALYAAALLAGGGNQHGSVLGPATLALMLDRAYETHPALPAMGLGFFRTDVGAHRVVSHDGILPGFNSHLSVAPDDGLGLVALTNGSSGAMRWIPVEMDALLRRLLDVGNGRREAVAHHPEAWPEILGCYRLPDRIGDLRGRLALGPGLEVFIGGGRPMLRLRWPIPGLSGGLPLVPDDQTDPRAFVADLTALGMGRVRLRFRRDPVTGRKLMHTDLGTQPVTFEEVADAGGPPAAALVAAGTVAIGLAVAARQRRRSSARRTQA